MDRMSKGRKGNICFSHSRQFSLYLNRVIFDGLFKNGQTPASFCLFSYFSNSNFVEKTEGFGGIWIVGVEGEHVTTWLPRSGLFWCWFSYKVAESIQTVDLLKATVVPFVPLPLQSEIFILWNYFEPQKEGD